MSAADTGEPVRRRLHRWAGAAVEPIHLAVVFFYRRADERLSCETRLNPDGPGYQLVITQDAHAHVEDFNKIAALLAREHELFQAWRAQGWVDIRGRPPR